MESIEETDLSSYQQKGSKLCVF